MDKRLEYHYNVNLHTIVAVNTAENAAAFRRWLDVTYKLVLGNDLLTQAEQAEFFPEGWNKEDCNE